MVRNWFNNILWWRQNSKDLTISGSKVNMSTSLEASTLDFDTNLTAIYLNDSEFDTTYYHKKVGGTLCDFMENAPLVPGDFKYPDPPLHPPLWVNQKSIKDGLAWVKGHFYSIFCAHILSLFLIVSLRPIQALLLRLTSFHSLDRQKPGNGTASFIFILKILCQIRKIYESLDSDDWSASPISKFKVEVRQLRILVRNASDNFRIYLPPVLSSELRLDSEEMAMYLRLRKQLDTSKSHQRHVPNLPGTEKILTTLNPTVPLSQYDLAVIQFCFFALPIRFPALFGLENWKESNARNFAHIWAVIGNSLGLKDQFNFGRLYEISTGEEWNTLAKEVHGHILETTLAQLNTLDFKLWIILGKNLRATKLGWILPVNITEILKISYKNFFQLNLHGLFGWFSKFQLGYHQFLIWISSWWIGQFILRGIFNAILSSISWYYIRDQTEVHMSQFDLTGSSLSLTRSIRWSCKQDGIQFV